MQARSDPGTGFACTYLTRLSHIPSSEKPGIELPNCRLRGSRLNHRLGAPVGSKQPLYMFVWKCVELRAVCFAPAACYGSWSQCLLSTWVLMTRVRSFGGVLTETCEPSLGSPWQEDCFALADDILKMHLVTEQRLQFYYNVKQSGDSGCNRVVSHGSCSGDLCVKGRAPEWYPGVSAGKLSSSIRMLASKPDCVINSAPPGQYKWLSGGKIERSPAAIWVNSKNPNCCTPDNYNCCSSGWGVGNPLPSSCPEFGCPDVRDNVYPQVAVPSLTIQISHT